MANIKSQKKRALTNAKANRKNSSEKSQLKTAIKKVNAAIAANDKDAAVEAFNKANALLDKAATSRLKHKNYVARQKSRLAKAVATLG
ncbi:MAG: 30S ribosomal protein S20 [Erysipelotrichaceae bacterium]|jgi:small subunit ribosomal protein S20|nr:30S ribosomal protein S20 [Erysipelotrichaceae bacterium]